MTTVEQPAITTDLEAALGSFAQDFLGTALGFVELCVAHFGRRLGLYQALNDAGPQTPGELAARSGLDARYVREWCEHQAVAGIVTVDRPDAAPEERRYELPAAATIALLAEEHPAYVGALADLPALVARTIEQLADAFRTGDGVPFAAYGCHDMQAGFTRPMFANSLTAEWLPALPDVHGRLAAGEPLRIADLGCGEGWAGIYVAEAYPAVTVDGFDLDDASIAAARRHASERGVADRVRFEVRDVAAPGFTGDYDLVLACEVIHDLPDPVGALAAMRRLTTGGGAVLVIDERTAERFAPDGNPIERLLYAVSILHCLPAGRAAEPSAATGTVMRPETFARYAQQAGFDRVEELPIEHPMFRFYRPLG